MLAIGLSYEELATKVANKIRTAILLEIVQQGCEKMKNGTILLREPHPPRVGLHNVIVFGGVPNKDAVADRWGGFITETHRPHSYLLAGAGLDE